MEPFLFPKPYRWLWPPNYAQEDIYILFPQALTISLPLVVRAPSQYPSISDDDVSHFPRSGLPWAYNERMWKGATDSVFS
jgi:hypothetical protein